MRAAADEIIARDAGAHDVVQAGPDLVQRVHALARDGVDHIVEVAFGANIAADLEMLAVRGSIVTYATDVDTLSIPFWSLLFRNIRIDFLGSDDVTAEDRTQAALAINDALVVGWTGFEIADRLPLDEIATAPERLEAPRPRGRVVLVL